MCTYIYNILLLDGFVYVVQRYAEQEVAASHIRRPADGPEYLTCFRAYSGIAHFSHCIATLCFKLCNKNVDLCNELLTAGAS